MPPFNGLTRPRAKHGADGGDDQRATEPIVLMLPEGITAQPAATIAPRMTVTAWDSFTDLSNLLGD